MDILDSDAVVKALPAICNRLLGGREIVVALMREQNGESTRKIAASMSWNHWTLRRRMDDARETLLDLGLWPANWKLTSKRAKPPAPSIPSPAADARLCCQAHG